MNTGICFDFHTNSNALELTFNDGRKFDVYVDGILYWCAGEPVIALALPEGEHRVTVIFPSHSRTVLRAFRLDDGASLRPHAFDRKILFSYFPDCQAP